MRNPERLEIIERSMELAILTYEATKTLPLDERTGLISQMQRASTSVGSNIAEGCGRSTDRAFLSYLQNAMGSLTELEFQTRLSLRLGLGNSVSLDAVLAMTRRVKVMLTRLTLAIRKRTP